MSYFTNEMTADEAKKVYRKLALQLHPDKEGGDSVKFIDLQNQYEMYLKGTLHMNEDLARAETTGMDEFIKANEFVKAYENVTVELTGSWVWLAGNTYPYREDIKSHGFLYSPTKKRWYKSPSPIDRTIKKRGLSFDKIKDTYGYEAKTINDTTKKIA